MSITLVADAINTFVDARCTLAVIEATTPNDTRRIEWFKREALRASNNLTNVLIGWSTQNTRVAIESELQIHQMIGHILIALDAIAGDNVKAHNAINAARSVVNINVKEQTQ